MNVLNPVMVNTVMSRLSVEEAGRVKTLLAGYKKPYNSLRLMLFARKHGANDLLDWLCGNVKGDGDIDLILAWNVPVAPTRSAASAQQGSGQLAGALGVVNHVLDSLEMFLGLVAQPLGIAKNLLRIGTGPITSGIFHVIAIALFLVILAFINTTLSWIATTVVLGAIVERQALSRLRNHQTGRAVLGITVILATIFVVLWSPFGSGQSKPTVVVEPTNIRAQEPIEVEVKEPWKAYQLTRVGWESIRTAIALQMTRKSPPPSQEFVEIGFPITDVWIGAILDSCGRDLSKTFTALNSHKRGCK